MHDTNSPQYVYKQGDEREALEATLHDSDGNVVDLSNAQSATLIIQSKSEFENDSNTLALNVTGQITDPANGVVEYQWQDGDLDLAGGRYYAVWRISWPDQGGDGVADDQTFPREGVLQIDVERTPTGSVDPASAPGDLTVTRLTASEVSGPVANGSVITSLVGSGLSVDANGNLNASTQYYTPTPVSAAHTASDGEFVLVDASTGAVTVTLPTPTTNTAVGIEKTDTSSNVVTVSPNGTESVNYGSAEDLVAQGESLDLISDGVDWYVV